MELIITQSYQKYNFSEIPNNILTKIMQLSKDDIKVNLLLAYPSHEFPIISTPGLLRGIFI